VPRLLDRGLDLRLELAATPQVAGVHPDRKAERLQPLAQLGDEGIVGGGVGEEDHGIWRHTV